MERLPVWLGAGAIAAGVSAAALAGAGGARADTEASVSGAASSNSAEASDPGPAGSTGTKDRVDGEAKDPDPDPSRDGQDAGDGAGDPQPGDLEPDDAEEADDPKTGDLKTGDLTDGDDQVAPEPSASVEISPERAPKLPSDEATGGSEQDATATQARTLTRSAGPAPDEESGATLSAAARVDVDTSDVSTPDDVVSGPAETPRLPPPFGLIDQLPPPVRALGSAAFDVLGMVINTVAGPPLLPPGSSVSVRSSTLRIDGRPVTADWYFPAGDEPPDRMIYLQHGFLANGRMYSYTAAMLAERTNSVVVAPTLSANPFTADDFWLGGDPMYRAVAELFIGDRDALHRSAEAAGYTTRYGDDAVLPDEFVMAGHSLGGGLVTGVAGYYAQAVTAGRGNNRLVGVVTLDGVPPRDDIVTKSLAALDGLDTYVPVYELHAPANLFNSFSTITEDLAVLRDGRFHGVELNRGVHMDSMLGGNPLIQLSAYLVAGFPAPHNPPAAQHLMAGWIDDMFAGRIDPSTGACADDDCQGVYGTAGATVEIPTGKGRATATVLGDPVPAARVTARVRTRHHTAPSAVPAAIWERDRNSLVLSVA